MNFKQKFRERQRVRHLFNPSYPEGTIKITSGESLIHARTKLEVGYWLKENNWDIWSEVTFFNGQRADLVAIHSNGMAFCFEILVSEKERDLLNKKYPISIIPIIAKDFNYLEFKL